MLEELLRKGKKTLAGLGLMAMIGCSGPSNYQTDYRAQIYLSRQTRSEKIDPDSVVVYQEFRDKVRACEDSKELPPARITKQKKPEKIDLGAGLTGAALKMYQTGDEDSKKLSTALTTESSASSGRETATMNLRTIVNLINEKPDWIYKQPKAGLTAFELELVEEKMMKKTPRYYTVCFLPNRFYDRCIYTRGRDTRTGRSGVPVRNCIPVRYPLLCYKVRE